MSEIKRLLDENHDLRVRIEELERDNGAFRAAIVALNARLAAARAEVLKVDEPLNWREWTHATVKAMMRRPEYWRDQDPRYVEAVHLYFKHQRDNLDVVV